MKYTSLIVILITSLVFLGCSDTSSSSQNNTPTSNTPLRVACVGDSITKGTGTTNSYPNQLSSMLGDTYSVQNFGNKGSTLIKTGSHPYTNTTEFFSSQDFIPDIVVIMLGTNDMKTQNITEIDRYVSDYKSLIDTYKNLSTQPIVYISYPPPSYGNLVGITNNKIANILLPKIQEVSQANNVTIIDAYNPLLNKKSLFPDTLHPNNEGARIIADTVARAIR